MSDDRFAHRFNQLAYRLREDPAATGERTSVCNVCGCEGDDPHDPACPVGLVERIASPAAPAEGLTDDSLAAIEARVNATTPAPWTHATFPEASISRGYYLIEWRQAPGLAPHTIARAVWPEYNAAFIAHAREDVPRLVAEVRRLRRSGDTLLALVRAYLATLPPCDFCDNAATCFGGSENDGSEGFACDDCCGHGGEDGHCEPVGDRALRAALDALLPGGEVGG